MSTREQAIRDLTDRIAHLRAASRIVEPMTEQLVPTAQGFIVKAIEELERRRTLLLVG
ncbi:MAG: hypothetical protein AB7O24_01115 [Kofleriaceae bacterium]